MSVPVITDGIATLAQNDYWDPPPRATDGNGKPLLYGQGPLYAGGWDTVILAGAKLPGRCSVKVQKSLQIDQQKGPKHDGATLIMHGVLPATVDISVLMWTQEQWAKWHEIVSKFWRKPTKDSPDVKALATAQKVSTAEAQKMMAACSIFWPGFNGGTDVSQVIVKDLAGPDNGEVPQSKVMQLKCIEFQPPTRKTSPSKVKNAPPIPKDAAVVTPPKPSEEGGSLKGD